MTEKWVYIWRHDTQHTDDQHNDAHYNISIYINTKKVTNSMTKLSIKTHGKTVKISLAVMQIHPL